MKRCFSFFLLFLSSVIICLAGTPNSTSFKSSVSPAFIENKGQIIDQNNKPNPGVLYLLNTPGFKVQLRKNGFSYDVYTCTSPPAPLLKERGDRSADSSLLLQEKGLKDEVLIQHPASSIEYHRIDFDLLNANPNPEIEASEPSSDYLNYYTTGTPLNGIREVRQFQRVTYKSIYPGIDLEFVTTPEGRYKYNFVIHPGGNISDIKLNIS
jgi:hypothetical protein